MASTSEIVELRLEATKANFQSIDKLHSRLVTTRTEIGKVNAGLKQMQSMVRTMGGFRMNMGGAVAGGGGGGGASARGADYRLAMMQIRGRTRAAELHAKFQRGALADEARRLRVVARQHAAINVEARKQNVLYQKAVGLARQHAQAVGQRSAARFGAGADVNAARQAFQGAGMVRMPSMDQRGYVGGQQITKQEAYYDKATNSIVKLDRATGKATVTAANFGDTMASAAGKVILWVAATTILFGAMRAVKGLGQTIVETEYRMAELRRVYTGSSGDIRALRDDLIDLSRAYGADASKVIEASAMFARMGLKRREIVQATKAALLAQKVAELDVVEAVNMLRAATIQFNKGATDTNTILDEWNELSNRNAVLTRDLGAAVATAGASWHEMGGSLEQLNAITMALAVATAKSGREIGNATKTMTVFAYRAESMSKIARVTGIEIRKNTGALMEIDDVLARVAVRWDTLTDAERNEVSQAIGGTRRRTYAISLMRNYDKVLKGIADQLGSTGSAEEEAGIMMDTVRVKTQQLTEELKKFAVGAGDAGAGSAMHFTVDMLKLFVQGLNEGNPVLGAMTSGTIALTAAMIGLRLAMMGNAKMAAAGGFIKYASSMDGFSGAVGGATAKMVGLGKATVSFIASPLGVTLAALVAAWILYKEAIARATAALREQADVIGHIGDMSGEMRGMAAHWDRVADAQNHALTILEELQRKMKTGRAFGDMDVKALEQVARIFGMTREEVERLLRTEKNLSTFRAQAAKTAGIAGDRGGAKYLRQLEADIARAHQAEATASKAMQDARAVLADIDSGAFRATGGSAGAGRSRLDALIEQRKQRAIEEEATKNRETARREVARLTEDRDKASAAALRQGVGPVEAQMKLDADEAKAMAKAEQRRVRSFGQARVRSMEMYGATPVERVQAQRIALNMNREGLDAKIAELKAGEQTVLVGQRLLLLEQERAAVGHKLTQNALDHVLAIQKQRMEIEKQAVGMQYGGASTFAGIYGRDAGQKSAIEMEILRRQRVDILTKLVPGNLGPGEDTALRMKEIDIVKQMAAIEQRALTDALSLEVQRTRAVEEREKARRREMLTMDQGQALMLAALEADINQRGKGLSMKEVEQLRGTGLVPSLMGSHRDLVAEDARGKLGIGDKATPIDMDKIAAKWQEVFESAGKVAKAFSTDIADTMGLDRQIVITADAFAPALNPFKRAVELFSEAVNRMAHEAEHVDSGGPMPPVRVADAF